MVVSIKHTSRITDDVGKGSQGNGKKSQTFACPKSYISIYRKLPKMLAEQSREWTTIDVCVSEIAKLLRMLVWQSREWKHHRFLPVRNRISATASTEDVGMRACVKAQSREWKHHRFCVSDTVNQKLQIIEDSRVQNHTSVNYWGCWQSSHGNENIINICVSEIVHQHL